MKLKELNELEYEIVNLYPRLKSYAIKLTKNMNIAEDLLHETILKAVENPEKFNNRESLIATLILTLRNKYYDLIKKKSPGEFNEIRHDTEVSESVNNKTAEKDFKTMVNETIWGPSILDAEKQSIMNSIYSNCLELLDKMSTDIFHMNLTDKRILTTKKIAEILEISQSKVLKIFASAKSKMMDCIKKGN